jgi:hypothetical protein
MGEDHLLRALATVASIGAVVAAVLYMALPANTGPREPTGFTPTPVVTDSDRYSSFGPPTPINCGPGDDSARLLLSNKVCISPDPDDVKLSRMLQSALPAPTVPYTAPNFRPSTSTGGGGSVCADGTISRSTGRGTCSWHGGVNP